MYIPTLNDFSLIKFSSFPNLPFHVVASLMTFAKLLAVAPLVICSKYTSIRIFIQPYTT